MQRHRHQELIRFAAHIPDGEQHLLPVAAQADRRQHQDVCGLAVQPGLDDGADQEQTGDVIIGETALAPCNLVDLHLAPCPADHILADRPLKQAEQRSLDLARVCAGQIDRGD
jgi:hypothetical protein